MPRATLTPTHAVEYLSILDERGEFDHDIAPDMPDDLLLRLHRSMLLARRFDERLLNLQRQGRLGTFAPVKGQEASQLGSAAALKASDWVVPSYREAGAQIWRGTPLEGLFLYIAGYSEGGRVPEGQNDLPIAVPVGTQMLHAVGLACGMKYRRDRSVVMTYFGDGATSEGDFHEAMNFAGVFQAPVVFVCQNNQWAISVPRAKQTFAATLAQKALSYGMPGVQVDGNDIFAVYAAASEAVEHARSGGGPTMIECLTYRLEVHTTADDPTRYREQEEVERWRERDPLPRLQKHLASRELLSEQQIDGLEEEIRHEIETAWQNAGRQMEELGGKSLVMFDHVFAERPPHLEEQRETFRHRLQARDGRAG